MGHPILTYPLSRGTDAGIRQEIQAGFVSEYECREVSRFVLVTWDQWLDMDSDARSKSVAHYRLSHAIEANVMDAQTKAQQQAQPRGRR